MLTLEELLGNVIAFYISITMNGGKSQGSGLAVAVLPPFDSSWEISSNTNLIVLVVFAQYTKMTSIVSSADFNLTNNYSHPTNTEAFNWQNCHIKDLN